MVQIKFIKFGANSAFGGFAPGDTLRTSEAMARHLVEEVGVAQYMQPKAPAPAPAAAEPPAANPAPAAPRARKAK